MTDAVDARDPSVWRATVYRHGYGDWRVNFACGGKAALYGERHPDWQTAMDFASRDIERVRHNVADPVMRRPLEGRYI